MTDLNYNDYLTPYIPDSKFRIKEGDNKDLLLNNVFFRKEDTKNDFINKFDLVIIGIQDERNTENKGARKAPDKIRTELYKLYSPSKIKLADLGNLKSGKTVKDTYIALTEIVYELLMNEMAVIFLGGSKDSIVPLCKAYEKGKKNFSICVAEPKFDLNDYEESHGPGSYLNEIISENKRLFNYSNIGYQSYYNSADNISYINDNYEAVRLGMARTFIFHNEPYIRDADFFAVDVKSVKRSDAPGTNEPSTNGFYGEEICQLSRYAGLSDKVSIFGIFELNPDLDKDNRTSELAAQMTWYFIQSFYNRKNEFPDPVVKKFQKYIVNIEGVNESINFYKSPKSGRWWVEVNYAVKNDERSRLVACSYEDYIKATRNEIPERWWKLFNKLN